MVKANLNDHLSMHYKELNNQVGNIDLYLLDQVLKGRFEDKHKILDAGCGEGRNLRYFINNGFEVYGIDNNPMAIQMAHFTYKQVPLKNWVIGSLEKLPWEDGYFDAIICNAVLHFANTKDQFMDMIRELVRVLKTNGVLFIRMASDIGLPKGHKDNDGFSFLLTQELYDSVLQELELLPIENFKTVIVEKDRSMVVLVLSKI